LVRYSLIIIPQRHIHVPANFFQWDKPTGSHPLSSLTGNLRGVVGALCRYGQEFSSTFAIFAGAEKHDFTGF
jgi:hypothetical protein